ncbi:MAG: ABC transporter permease [Bacteroidetes bacterium]|nr:ABC transporter permease [Bacteroidota bacterium]
MLRLTSTIRKELLILLRDRAGLAILFLMPMAMITIMALIQDAPFRDYQELKIPLLLVNNDTSTLGRTLEADLKKSKIFEITLSAISEDQAKQSIASGKYEIGIIVPSDATQNLNAKINYFVSKALSKIGLQNSIQTDNAMIHSELNVVIYFAPGTKKSFKASILSSLKQFSSKLETQLLLDYFTKELNKPEVGSSGKSEPLEDFVNFVEQDARESKNGNFELNSVQHNVPAWTIFGMFFIVVSMAGSIIKERDDGSYLRILTMPGSYITVLVGKITAYLFICLIQCVLMMLVGIYLMPLLGLPSLVIGSSIIAITLIALCSGLAATGYGVMVGTLFNTHQQASTFGAVSIIILAALGGIWVPVYVMPDSIRMFAEFSPLYWGLSAFQSIFLGNGSVQNVLPYALKLFLFFISTTGIAHFYNKIKRH